MIHIFSVLVWLCCPNTMHFIVYFFSPTLDNSWPLVFYPPALEHSRLSKKLKSRTGLQMPTKICLLKGALLKGVRKKKFTDSITVQHVYWEPTMGQTLFFKNRTVSKSGKNPCPLEPMFFCETSKCIRWWCHGDDASVWYVREKYLLIRKELIRTGSVKGRNFT